MLARDLPMETPPNPPPLLDALARIEAKLDRLEHRLARFEALAETMPNLLAIVGDTFDDYAREQTERGVDIELVMRNFGPTLEAMLRLIGSAQLRQLLESEILQPAAIESLGEAARALAQAQAAPPSRLGLFGLLRELRDPDVQRTLGMVVDVARRLGHQLQPQLPAAQEPTP